LRREINTSGKSRAFINDTPVKLDLLREIGGFLMDVHSQHDTLLLESNSFQLWIIDTYAENQELRIFYQEAYHDFKGREKKYTELVSQADEIRKEADYNHFLFEELEKAQLEPDEKEKLENDLSVLEHFEEIKSSLNQVVQILENSDFSVQNNLYQVSQLLSSISSYSDQLQQLHQRIESSLIEIKDLVLEVSREEEMVEYDPQNIEIAQERLNLILGLEQKHKVNSISQLLEIKNQLSLKVEKVLNLDQQLADSEADLDKARKSLEDLGIQLTNSRKSVVDDLALELTDLLKDLGMPDSTVSIQSETSQPTSSGIDQMKVLFSANKGIPPQELKKVASGGEFSRLMFCIKFILTRKTALPTIIFDEIDSGVSGEIANKMVSMMKRMAENHQVIAISHLPQIAAKGNAHYFVYKESSSEKAVSKIKKLSEDERILEVAKMISGDNPSETAFQNARELIESEIN